MNTNEAADKYDEQQAREEALKNMDLVFPEGFKFEAGKKYKAVISEVPGPSSSTKENIQRESTESTESMKDRY